MRFLASLEMTVTDWSIGGRSGVSQKDIMQVEISLRNAASSPFFQNSIVIPNGAPQSGMK